MQFYLVQEQMTGQHQVERRRLRCPWIRLNASYFNKNYKGSFFWRQWLQAFWIVNLSVVFLFYNHKIKLDYWKHFRTIISRITQKFITRTPPNANRLKFEVIRSGLRIRFCCRQKSLDFAFTVVRRLLSKCCGTMNQFRLLTYSLVWRVNEK